MIEDATFDSRDHVSHELLRYTIHDNEMRPHRALGGIPPKAVLDTPIAS